METTVFAIVRDLRFAICDRLRSSAIVCNHMENSLKYIKLKLGLLIQMVSELLTTLSGRSFY